MPVPDNGYVLASSIGGDGILCNTDKGDCCKSPNGFVQGHWYNTEGKIVGDYNQEYDKHSNGQFFARNREKGIVRLYRIGNPSERGLFHCEIPNASGNTEIRYVNIGECFHINPHGLWYRNLLLFS